MEPDAVWLVLALHLLFLVLGSLGIEIFLSIRNGRAYNRNRKLAIDLSQVKLTISEGFTLFRSQYSNPSRRLLASLSFGLSCLTCFGFDAMICLAGHGMSRDIVMRALAVDVLGCWGILFIIVPAGLCHKYAGLREGLTRIQRLCQILLAILVWLLSGFIISRLSLNLMLANRNEALGFTLAMALYVSGFGLCFIAILTGFSAIYVPYRLYMIRRDIKSIRQLDNRIYDANKAIRQLKFEIASIARENRSFDSESDSCYECDDEADSFEFYRTGNYTKLSDVYLREIYQKQYKYNVLHYFRQLCNRILNRPEPRSDLNLKSAYNSLIQLMYVVKQELEYLKDIKREKEFINTNLGKAKCIIKYAITSVCMFITYSITNRVVKVFVLGFSSDNFKSNLSSTYHSFMSENVIKTVLTNVLDKQKENLSDNILSRLCILGLTGIILSNIGNFLDFGIILLKTKYLQKNLLLTDNTLGLALSGFLILSVPSQFCLIIPYLPKTWKAAALEMLFEGDVYIWVCLRYTFEYQVFLTAIFTMLGIAFLHYTRMLPNVSQHVVCNV